MEKSSTNSPQKPNLNVSREKIAAMSEVLGKRWLSKGWRPMEGDDAKFMALAFIELLDVAKIPFEHYNELYRRSIKLRADRLSKGLECEEFEAELMIACWPELKHELEQSDINSGRLLVDHVAEGCGMCHGTGMWNPDGEGMRNGCPHSS